jgi:hypothetical protein
MLPLLAFGGKQEEVGAYDDGDDNRVFEDIDRMVRGSKGARKLKKPPAPAPPPPLPPSRQPLPRLEELPPKPDPFADLDFYDSDDDDARRSPLRYESGDELDELDEMEDLDRANDIDIDEDVLEETVGALDSIIRGEVNGREMRMLLPSIRRKTAELWKELVDSYRTNKKLREQAEKAPRSLQQISDLVKKMRLVLSQFTTRVTNKLTDEELTKINQRFSTVKRITDELSELIEGLSESGTDIVSSSDDESYFEVPRSVIEDVRNITNDLALAPNYGDNKSILKTYLFPLVLALLSLTLYMTNKGGGSEMTPDTVGNLSPLIRMIAGQELGAAPAKRLPIHTHTVCE